ncbi:hypothetical protein EV363DRAFT_1432725 [Boletus edulis]|nr:hypothetical protein EV363DRAFT_1432725 [Boletus edulis]
MMVTIFESMLRCSSVDSVKVTCDALIVCADMDRVFHVPLPSPTASDLGIFKTRLRLQVGPFRVTRDDEMEGQAATRPGISWESFLSTLWNGVVKLALDAQGFPSPKRLSEQTPGDLSRIFWCPAGPFGFFPILAAGLYGTQPSGPGNNVITSPLSASFKLQLLPNPTLTAIPAYMPSASHIPTVNPHFWNPPWERLLDPTNKVDWVHFACHGIQDADNPIESGLSIAARRRLKLSDIIPSSRPRGEPAFFVCVQTATGGDKDQSDAAIHTAAGMLLAEHRGVVSTMWSSTCASRRNF